MKMFERPGSMILLKGCRNVLIKNITLRDAPTWTIHLNDCDIGNVRGVRILNNPLVPNNDGIHCVTCRNVRGPVAGLIRSRMAVSNVTSPSASRCVNSR